ncbi:MAG: caspase family protein, partial [Hydrogenophaga sp.]
QASCGPNSIQQATETAPHQTSSAAPRAAAATQSTLSITANTSSPDSNGVFTLNITTNSNTASLRVNGDEVGSRADGRYSVQRFAQIGDNNFEVIATDRFGNTRKQTISVSRQAADNTVRFASLNPIAVRARPANNAVAIIIGIQDYSRVPKAEFASNDARVFYDYAIRGLGVRPENIKILLDQEASDIGILSAFKNWLPLKTRKGQTDVYVFFSGHGLPSDDGSNLYMLPYGVDRQFLDRTAIKQSELIASLQAVSPRSVTMFMDACYSGQIRTGETLLASARPIAIQSKASSFPSNFNVISASAPDQLASSSPDLKHGVFSYFLMKGMEGEADENRDGNITMAEMQSYLKEYVGKKAMSLNRTQVPQLTGDQSRVLVSR